MLTAASSPAQVYRQVTTASLHPELDGSQGENRGLGRAQVAANRDWDAIQLWLAQYPDGSPTRKAYEKEVTRFYVWVLSMRRKAFSSVVYEDWTAYDAFMADPQPAADWIGARRHARGTPDYRPFAGPLSLTSRNYARTVLWSLFEWLRSVGYLAGNPIILPPRQRRPAQASFQTRFLTEDLWQSVLSSIDRYPQDTLADQRRYAQARWLVTLFYLTGIRTSEAVNAAMGDFVSMPDPRTGQRLQFLYVVGKGSKPRQVPATRQLLDELSRYRRAFGLPDAPAPHEATPLVFSLQTRAGLKPLTRQTLYLAMKSIFQKAAETLRAIDPVGADTLLTASTHWLRHTAASDMLNKGIDPRTVQGTLGHKSLATTGIYSHQEALRLHRDIEGRHDMRWQGGDEDVPVT